MTHEKTSLGQTVGSAAAFLIIALALAGVAGWIGWLLFSVQEEAAHYSSRVVNRSARATAGLGLGALAAAVGALFFAAVGFYTLWLGLTAFRKNDRQDDDSWKDMPYPKG
jgi:hypothetical protein